MDGLTTRCDSLVILDCGADGCSDDSVLVECERNAGHDDAHNASTKARYRDGATTWADVEW